MPYFVALVAFLGDGTIVVKMALAGDHGCFWYGSSLPFVFVLPFCVGAEFLIHQVIGQLNSLIQRLGSGRLNVPINVVRKSTDELSHSRFRANKLGTYQVSYWKASVYAGTSFPLTFRFHSSISNFLILPCGQYLSVIFFLSTSQVITYASGLMVLISDCSPSQAHLTELHGGNIYLSYSTTTDIEKLNFHASQNHRVVNNSTLQSLFEVQRSPDASGESGLMASGPGCLTPPLLLLTRWVLCGIHHDHDGSEVLRRSPDIDINPIVAQKLFSRSIRLPPSLFISVYHALWSSASSLTLVLTSPAVIGHYRADKTPLIYPPDSVGHRVELFQVSFMELGWTNTTSCRGGCSDSGISSLRSTGGGMYRDGGSGGSRGDGNAWQVRDAASSKALSYRGCDMFGRTLALNSNVSARAKCSSSLLSSSSTSLASSPDESPSSSSPPSIGYVNRTSSVSSSFYPLDPPGIRLSKISGWNSAVAVNQQRYVPVTNMAPAIIMSLRRLAGGLLGFLWAWYVFHGDGGVLLFGSHVVSEYDDVEYRHLRYLSSSASEAMPGSESVCL
ncbi:hypothetical protein Tco_1209280 [Tanacetum coccineum]